jgi:drug/metabolite transporter (DMT)-like permease
MIEVFLALGSALFYGAADFCGGLASKRVPMFAVTVLSQTAGFAVLLVALTFLPGHAVASDYLYGGIAGIFGGLGIALLYHALSIGKMGVVSPITAVLAAAVPVAVGAARGEHLQLLQYVGIGIAFIAIALISFSLEEGGIREISTKGVREAILSGLLIGGFLFFLAQTHPDAGVHNLVGARVTSILFLLGVGVATRTNFRVERASLPLILFSGVIDMTANILYVMATFNGYLSIAAVITSLYPASTVFLARFVLGERLAFSQKCGVGLALAGVLLIAFRR